MSNYAIIKTGGKQVKVEEGSVIYVEKLNVEAGQTVTFDEVIFVGGETTKVGAPLVEGATVVGEVEKHGKQKKVVTFQYKPKNTHTVNKVTVNHTLKLLSNQLTLNYD